MDILTGIIAGTGFFSRADESSHHHSEPDSMLGYSEQGIESVSSSRTLFHPQYSCSNRTIMIKDEMKPSNLSQPPSPLPSITNNELLFLDKPSNSMPNRIISDSMKKSSSNNLIKQNNTSDPNGNNDQDGQYLISITNPQTLSNPIFSYTDYTTRSLAHLSNFYEQNKNNDNNNNNYLTYGCSSDIGDEFGCRYSSNYPVQCDHIGQYTHFHHDNDQIDNNNNDDNEQKLVKKSSLKKCSQFGSLGNGNVVGNPIHYSSGSTFVNHDHIGSTHHLYHHHNHNEAHQSNSYMPKYNYYPHCNKIMDENATPMLPKKIPQPQTQPSLETHQSIVSSANIEKPKSPKTSRRLLKSCKKHMEVLNFVLKGGPPWGFRIKQRNGSVFISKVCD